MTIKLNAASGGSVALDAPTQTTSSADLTFKLPVADGSANQVIKTDGSGNLSFGTAGNANGLQVLEEFFVPCDGTAVTTAQGSVSIPNVTAAQDATSTLTTCTGSEISYLPPANTKIVIYTYQFAYTYKDASTITGFQIQLDGAKVNKRAYTVRGYNNNYHPVTITHPFRIESGLSADADVGRVQSWSSAKTIRVQMRYWANNYEATIHQYGEAFKVDEANNLHNNVFSMPCIGIKAIGSV
tara:strand:+ start:570 stop:1292 length:723 start_codon:yes stop_codon:yes gene_type:complete